MADANGNNSRFAPGAPFNTPFPALGIAAGALDSTGTNMVPLNVDASGNLKIAGNFTATLGGTTAVNITQVGNTAVTLGQAVMATSFPVVIASDQSAIPVTGSFSATNPAVGTTGNAVPASGDFIGINVAGNLQGLTGVAVVNATAYAGRFDLSSFNGTALTIGQQVMTASIPVVLASNQSNLTTVLGAALPAGTNAIGTVSITQAIPGGSNAIGTVSALQLGTWAVNLTQVGGTTLTFGQAVMATSIPVAIASNQSTLSVAGTLTAVISGTPPFNLAQVGATAISLGQKVSATSFPVVIASCRIEILGRRRGHQQCQFWRAAAHQSA